MRKRKEEKAVAVVEARERGRPRLFTNEEVIDAIEQAHGIYAAAKVLGVAAQTIYKYMEKEPEIKQAYEAMNERTTDIAVNKLYEAVKRGERWAVMFQLRTLGKQRGYTMKEEVETRIHVTVEETNDWRGGSKRSEDHSTELTSRGDGSFSGYIEAQDFGGGSEMAENDFGDEG